jgi:hypothetical protein
MQYMLLIYQNDAARAQATPGQMQEMFAAYGAYTEAMKKSGAFIAGDALQPASTATTVRVEGGKNKVLNGPYAETKEQLGGYYLIEAPDLDAAIAWAARCPGAAFGALEVRPVMKM